MRRKRDDNNNILMTAFHTYNEHTGIIGAGANLSAMQS
jgi:hypothetical protein